MLGARVVCMAFRQARVSPPHDRLEFSKLAKEPRSLVIDLFAIFLHCLEE
jgi:hypothetical protein